MPRTTLLIPPLYVVVGLGLAAFGWFEITGGEPDRDIALWIVLPIAWWVSFLPAAAAVLAIA